MLPLRNHLYLVTNRQNSTASKICEVPYISNISKHPGVPSATSQAEFVFRCMEAVKAGVRYVQIRDSDHQVATTLKSAYRLKEFCDSFGAKLIINNRVDVALASNAHGVHLGQNDFPYKDARKLLKNKIIGLTVNTWKEVEEAEASDVDYFGVTVWRSKITKPDCYPWELEGLKKIRDFSKKKIVAIGNITLTNMFEVLKILHEEDSIAMAGDLWRGETAKIAKQVIENIRKFQERADVCKKDALFSHSH